MGETSQMMPGSENPRPQPTAAEPPRPNPPRPPQGATFPGPAAFRAGSGAEDRLIGQVAFAMAAEAGQPPRDAEAIQALRDQATTALSDFAFRYLHNRIDEIRSEAAAEGAARGAQGPGLPRLVLANLIALAIAGALGYAFLANSHLLAGLGGR